jgi:hypothetical protein
VALEELPVAPIIEDDFSVAANASHQVSVHDYLGKRQDLPGTAKILAAQIFNRSNSLIKERQRSQRIESTDRPTLRFPQGVTVIEIEEQDGFAISSGGVIVELTLGVNPAGLTPRQRDRWGFDDDG